MLDANEAAVRQSASVVVTTADRARVAADRRRVMAHGIPAGLEEATSSGAQTSSAGRVRTGAISAGA